MSWSRAFAARFGGGELIMDGLGGVLGQPERGWLTHVHGPGTPPAWPEQLPGEGGKVVELTTALSSDWADRQGQLQWVLQAAAVFATHLGAGAAYLPAYDKLVLPPALEAAAAGSLRPDQALRFWARTQTVDGHVVTSGLRQLGLPEIEAEADLAGDDTLALVRWLGAKLIASGEDSPAEGTDLVADERTFTIVPGRRGPRRGRSYGRWGAIRVTASEDRFKRGSRTRMRVPNLSR